MTETGHPWDRREGENNRWFQRFDAFRLLGASRSLLAAVNQEKARKGLKESRNAPGSWKRAAKMWDWFARAEAWDRYLVEQAEAAQETAWKEKIMGPNETLARMSEHARNDLREFFKISERWTEHPLPTEEVLKDEEREVATGDGKTEMRTFYQVKCVVLNLEALLDPEKSHRVKKFADSPKNGVSIELYNADDAAELMAKHHKLLTDQVDVKLEEVVKGYIGVSPDDWDTGEEELPANELRTEP